MTRMIRECSYEYDARPGAAVGAGDHLPERALEAEPERVRGLRGTAQEQRKDAS